ncbi:SDR family oxidoreductase [Marivibrio halodurans]|uniref:SDR family oxidoreductase n=1 Tax=Marivibrio halodurans TaxID=2039722 RepID=A0A8J7S4S1_9PROT|nr:SDR family oxidoreductase [Marivibrio halodurans]MBP5858538.1 SDR family oxidoreductase [Marivibrio halodurans]
MQLDGKVAVVTGAARGIGLACVERFLREGARVVLSDVDAEAGTEAVEALTEHRDRVVFQACDVGNRGEVERMIGTAVDRFGRVDIMISNAGMTSAAEFLDVTEESFDRVVRVNLKGVFHCGQVAARQMVDQGTGGAIVNTASVASELAMPNQIAYAATKGAVRQITKAMALSLAPYGIRVNAIAPGSIETEMIRSLAKQDPSFKNTILSRTPLRRLGDPSEIASTMLFLVGDDASYVTGQTLFADGGRLSLNFTVPVDAA